MLTASARKFHNETSLIFGLVLRKKEPSKVEKRSRKRRFVKDLLFTCMVLGIALLIGLLLKFSLNATDQIPLIFVLGVMVIALKTDGFWWGISSSTLTVFIINFVFIDPFLGFNFSPYTIPSAIVTLSVSVITSTLTTRIKEQEKVRIEGEKEQIRANLLRAVSHDLRTPLTAIYGATSTIIDKYDELTKEQQIELLYDVKNDSEWLTRMVENLLSVTRVTGHDVRLKKNSIVLEELVGTTVSKFNKMHPGQNLIVDVPDQFITIQGDAILLEQVMINLLENAVFHATGMTWIKLTVTENGAHVIFKVIDNGCGIPHDRLKTIFNGTWNSQDETADSRRSNMGIGLSVCYSIIKAHGGTMTASNESKGGAVFSFTLDKENEDE